jgi:hypothetical protein
MTVPDLLGRRALHAAIDVSREWHPNCSCTPCDVWEAAMFRWMVVSLIVALGSVSVAQAQGRGRVLWTVSGAGAGFGVGLWAGLSTFDDAVNSDRKVWTSAIVGAGVGAVAGYLIGRSRSDHSRPSTTAGATERLRQEASERRLLEQVAKSFRFEANGSVRRNPGVSLGLGFPHRTSKFSTSRLLTATRVDGQAARNAGCQEVWLAHALLLAPV